MTELEMTIRSGTNQAVLKPLQTCLWAEAACIVSKYLPTGNVTYTGGKVPLQWKIGGSNLNQMLNINITSNGGNQQSSPLMPHLRSIPVTVNNLNQTTRQRSDDP